MNTRADHSVPTILLKMCEYRKSTKSLGIASEFFGMPKRFAVRSHFTNKLVEFVVVGEDDPLFSQDGWDGEQQVYRPTIPTKNVAYAVVYHQY